MLPAASQDGVVSLGEGATPLLPLKRLGGVLGFSSLWTKDESFNATGSFKARGMSVAVTKARSLGVREVCVPTAGNAGGALAAYCAAAGLMLHVYMPEDTPRVNVDECRAYGADVHLVKGLINDAAEAMNLEKDARWFDMSTLKEPYRLEGKKTMGYELAEQYRWTLPDVVVYPTGGGTGLIGMWKAFAEMQDLGWIDHRRPRMVAVQSKGCAPIVRAFDMRANVSAAWDNAETIASGLRVPKPFADTLILNVLYESDGCAIAVDDAHILESMKKVAMTEGILFSPEGAATIAALPTLRDRGIAGATSSILVWNTGSGLKYGEALQRALCR
jgi:threonine synthase